MSYVVDFKNVSTVGLESLAIKRNELAIKMQRNPSLRDPNSHLMKEFREIYSKMAEIENFLIKDHIEINLGEIKHVLHVDDDEILPFWLYQIPKLKNKDFGAIVTSGFSMMPLNVPSELNFIFSYLEFLVTIPSDFPLPMKNEKKYEFCWFIEKLKFFISYIHRDRTYFTHSHTYGNGNPPKPFIKSSGICGFLFQYPVEEIPPNFWEFGIPPIKNIHFIQLIPMYENELYYVLDNSDEKLMKLFKDRKIPRYLDMKRKNSLSEKGYNNSNYGKSSTFCKKCGTVIKNIDPTQ
ncbi:MAG: suppressor of fused domain protein, partial [Candidatus Lokiarchaeota archaeon]